MHNILNFRFRKVFRKEDKDPAINVKDYLTSLIAKIGENIVIRRFIRYKVGE
jgi:translation elongation factor EF-Ts